MTGINWYHRISEVMYEVSENLYLYNRVRLCMHVFQTYHIQCSQKQSVIRSKLLSGSALI